MCIDVAKKKLLLISIPMIQVLFLDLLGAQNLIHNPSFECSIEAPCLFTSSETYYSFPNYACNWFLPNHGSSDIFSTKVPKECWTSMPVSTYLEVEPPVGSQLPRTGDRFAGIYTYSDFLFGGPSYREYLEIKLDSALVPGISYCAELYTSLAERPKYASNNLGMLFHDEKIDSDDWIGDPWATFGVSLPYKPQVVETLILEDTINWVRVNGIFEATSPAKYLTIGNFSDDHNTLVKDKAGKFPLKPNYLNAYYFIDDVSLTRFYEKTFSFAGNTEICKGTSSTIEASGLEDMTWTTLADPLTIVSNDGRLVVNPDITTSYCVSGRNCSKIVKDTITIVVHPRPTVNLGTDITFCMGETSTLDAGVGFTDYMWPDKSSSRFLEVSEAGDYIVHVENQYGCEMSDTLHVSIHDIPEVNLGNDTLLCNENFYTLTAGSGQNDYLWSTGSTEPILTPTSSGKYEVTVRNECGESQDSVTIYSMRDIFVPNVITANGDDLNAKFEINGTGDLGNPAKLNIFNRWGSQIFADSNYQNNWPRDTENIVAGIYFYTLDYPGCKSFKGLIHILK